jgi:transposase-like protein
MAAAQPPKNAMAQSTPTIRRLPTSEEIRGMLRTKVVEAIQEVLLEEVAIVLGCSPSERIPSRNGYRNGVETRKVTTENGSVELKVPRARVSQPDGGEAEFRSTMLPRYQRRTRQVDEALLGAYLAGANTRRIRKALEPLLGEANLSKSSISRVVQRVKGTFEEWSARSLEDQHFGVMYLDGIHMKVRMTRRVISVPVLVALGVREDGLKELISLRLVGSESRTTWSALIEDLSRRKMPSPVVVVSDGHAGLTRAIELWPQAQVQRCAIHKLRNLLGYCPKHAHPELKRDYHAIIYAKDGIAARAARDAFLRKWWSLCAEVARSFEEAGDHLLTFFAFPKAMWKSLRSTNAIEGLNREFRRRTKTQGSFSTEDSALFLLWGLVAFGQIKMRKIDGYRYVASLLASAKDQAA